MLESPFSDIEQKLTASVSGAMRVFGVRRCGNHAIINWLIRNSGAEAYVFLNSCTNSRSAVQTCGASEVNGRFYGNKHRLAKVIEAQILQVKAAPFLLVSYEAGLQPVHYDSGIQTLGVDDYTFGKEILITRSFVNWLPSFSILVGRMNPKRMTPSVEDTADTLSEISVYKAHLKAIREYRARDKFVHVSFDDWYVNIDYRLAKLNEVGLPSLENTMGIIQRYGGGSSFSDQIDPNGMAVTERWRGIQDPQLLHIIRLALMDTELLDLLAEFYPDDTGILRGLVG